MGQIKTDYQQEDFTYDAIAQPKLGILIKENRKAQKLSQRQLGEELGVSYQTVSYWENGSRAPVPEKLIRIAKALGRPDDFFFHRVPAPKNESAIFFLWDNLRNLRRAHSISQVKLSEETGIALNKIKAYEDENSGWFITDENLEKLSGFFGVEPKKLLGHSSTEESMMKITIDNLKHEIQEATEILNIEGLQKAAERIKEMTEIKRYRK